MEHIRNTLQELCFLHKMEKLCNMSRIYGEIIVNLIIRMNIMEVVWRYSGE